MTKIQDFSKLSEAELIQLVKTSNSDNWKLVLICDELLKRKVPIRELKRSFESLFLGLSRNRLLQIDQEDYKFSKGTVYAAIHEMNRRGVKTLSWFWNDSAQHGPFNRMELDKELSNQFSENIIVWKEGMKDWRKMSEMPHLLLSYYFDQEFLAQEVISAPHIATQKSNPSSNSGTALFLGIMQIVAAPFWIGIGVWSFISGFWSITGPILPLMLSLSFCLLSIPVGIGLIGSKKWAYQVRLVIGVITVLWFMSRFFVDSASLIWMLMACYEIILLSLLIINAQIFNK